MASENSKIVLEEETDPATLANAAAQDKRFARNWAWFESHASEIYASYRGKCVCIAGEEIFVGDTPEEVIAAAMAAHPEDDGRFTRIIPQEKVPRIYVGRRCMASMR
jgi:hypothetical protein